MNTENVQTEKKLLEVGDWVFDYRRFGGLYRLQIERVTAKQAFSGHYKFNREITQRFWDGKPTNEWRIRKIGEYGHVSLQTPELLTQYRKEQVISKAKGLHDSFRKDLINEQQAKRLIELYESINAENQKPQ